VLKSLAGTNHVSSTAILTERRFDYAWATETEPIRTGNATEVTRAWRPVRAGGVPAKRFTERYGIEAMVAESDQVYEI